MDKTKRDHITLKIYCTYCVFTAVIAFLFYDSVYAFFIAQVLFPFYYRNRISEYKGLKKVDITGQFCEMLGSLSTLLSAGLSVENAFIQCENEMIKMYGEDSAIVYELADLNNSIRVNVPIAACLKEFAKRTGVEDIDDFATVFIEATRSGGNLIEIVRNTVLIIQDKRRTEEEINAMLKGKLLEQKVISVIPFLIFIYLRISSREYVEVLYHNILGISVMTICLVVYVVSLYMSKKIVDIQV